MLENARKKFDTKVVEALDWQTFMKELNKKQVLETPWCKKDECEEEVKKKSKNQSQNLEGEEESLSGSAKTLCMPLK